MIQVVKHLPSKCEALSSNLTTTKKKKKKKRVEGESTKRQRDAIGLTVKIEIAKE
jgi:hypothetical protein